MASHRQKIAENIEQPGQGLFYQRQVAVKGPG